MLLLALDTTLGACSAALYDSGSSVVLAAHHQLMVRGHAEALPPMVDACFRDTGLSPKDLNRIAVTIGPGTFTGIRIGLSLAHGMAGALGIPVIGINTLRATAVPLLETHETILIVHEAGGTGKYHAARFAEATLATSPDSDVRVATLAGCVALLGDANIIAGTGADAVADAGTARTARRVAGQDLPLAAGFAGFAATLPVSEVLPQPLYLREPDARPNAASATLRPADQHDIAALASIHRRSFDPGWNEDSLRSGLSLPGAGALVAEMHGMIRSFVQFHIVADEAEIVTFCTLPDFRKQGLASALIAGLKRHVRSSGVKKIFLEVAADNSAARELYAKAGFLVTGERKNYYACGSGRAEDAITMTCVLD